MPKGGDAVVTESHRYGDAHRSRSQTEISAQAVTGEPHPVTQHAADVLTALSEASGTVLWLQRKWMSLVPRWKDDGALEAFNSISVAILDARDELVVLDEIVDSLERKRAL